MANKKISALTAATTPLAGTELVPIVQSGSTVKVNVSDLTGGLSTVPVSKGGTGLTSVTAGYIPFGNTASALNTSNNFKWDNTNVRLAIGLSNADATANIQTLVNTASGNTSSMQKWSWADPSASATWGLQLDQIHTGSAIDYCFKTRNNSTTPNNSLFLGHTGGVSIGDTTDPGAGNLRLGTGNLVIGTSGKGIDFSATAGTGTSELLADYEEGTWTPTVAAGSGSITSYSSLGTYTKCGRLVVVSGYISIDNNGTGGTYLNCGGLPYTVGNYGGSGAVRSAGGSAGGQTSAITASASGTSFSIWTYNNGYPGSTGTFFTFSFSYFV